MLPQRRELFSKLALLVGAAAAGAASPAAAQAQAPAKRFIKRDSAERSGYSMAVVTQGGRTIWLAGQTGAVDGSGKSLAGNLDAQVHQVFANLGATLAEAGGKLSDMVSMTVFLTDPRNHQRFTAMRREILGENFPVSAAIYISHLASPDALLEIQGVAVVA